MANVFDTIVAGGYFVGFGGLTAEQEECRAFTVEKIDTLLHIRQREKYVKNLMTCLSGHCPADEDEPMEDSNFSQWQFFKPFTEDIIYFHEKFDFLIKCVANAVCKVEAGFEERYRATLIDVLTFRDTTVPASPEFVLELRSLSTPRTIGERPRTAVEQQLSVDSYVHKRNVYADKIRAELLDLEREQFELEKQRGMHPSIMKWSPPASPSHGERADAALERMRAQIEMAKEQALLSEEQQQQREDEALIRKYQLQGLDVLAQENAVTNTPLLTMLLNLQREQLLMDQRAQRERDIAAC